MPIRPASLDVERQRVHVAAQALEGLLMKQLVAASKAFEGGEGAGNAVRAGMFADTLADALVKAGGIGLARQIEDSVLPRPPGAAPAPGAAPTASPARSSSEAPATLPRITSGFGLRQDPFDGHLTRHAGVDLAGAEGAPIEAAAGGVVRRAGALAGYGDAVEIDHGGGLTTLYAHASEVLVHEGDRVARGQVIARVGHTGRATGPHLHFEVRQDGKAVDPRTFLPGAGGPSALASPLLDDPTSLAIPAPPDRPTAPRAQVALKIYGQRADTPVESGS